MKYLLKLFQQSDRQGLPFDEAVGRSLKAALVSPNFLYRLEQDGGAEQRIDDYDLASRLSYFVWLSMPDETLFDLAREGRLREPDVVRGQVRRMIRDPRADAFSSRFISQWLGSVELGRSAKPDTGVFPEYSGSLEESMKREVVEFFRHLLQEDGSLLQLIDADYLTVNEELAAHYGISGVTGREFRKVPIQDRNRGGVIGMAGLLTTASLPVRTSPVLRGKWVLETLLGKELPPPPPDAGDLPEPTPATEGLTLRQRFEQHRESPQCAACHDRIDPIGYGLENYDAIGRWRLTDENDRPLDTVGELPDGEHFNGPAELKDILLSRKETFARTVTERMLAFALGRLSGEKRYTNTGFLCERGAICGVHPRPSVTIRDQVAWNQGVAGVGFLPSAPRVGSFFRFAHFTNMHMKRACFGRLEKRFATPSLWKISRGAMFSCGPVRGLFRGAPGGEWWAGELRGERQVRRIGLESWGAGGPPASSKRLRGALRACFFRGRPLAATNVNPLAPALVERGGFVMRVSHHRYRYITMPCRGLPCHALPWLETLR